MIAAAVALVATFAQAAKVGWTCAGATDFADGNYALFVGALGKSVDTAAIQAAIVEAGGLSGVEGAFATGSITSAGGISAPNSTSGKSISWSGDGTDRYYAVLFVEDADGTIASFSGEKYIDLANDTTGKTWNFGAQGTAFGNNEFEIGTPTPPPGPTPDTPEPTSGLLLLLGVAGLALKRKRA